MPSVLAIESFGVFLGFSKLSKKDFEKNGLFKVLYSKNSHTFDSNKIKNGEIKMLSKNELIKNDNGIIIYCKIKNDKLKCAPTYFRAK